MVCRDPGPWHTKNTVERILRERASYKRDGELSFRYYEEGFESLRCVSVGITVKCWGLSGLD